MCKSVKIAKCVNFTPNMKNLASMYTSIYICVCDDINTFLWYVYENLKHFSSWINKFKNEWLRTRHLIFSIFLRKTSSKKIFYLPI